MFKTVFRVKIGWKQFKNNLYTQKNWALRRLTVIVWDHKCPFLSIGSRGSREQWLSSLNLFNCYSTARWASSLTNKHFWSHVLTGNTKRTQYFCDCRISSRVLKQKNNNLYLKDFVSYLVTSFLSPKKQLFLFYYRRTLVNTVQNYSTGCVKIHRVNTFQCLSESIFLCVIYFIIHIYKKLSIELILNLYSLAFLYLSQKIYKLLCSYFLLSW